MSGAFHMRWPWLALFIPVVIVVALGLQEHEPLRELVAEARVSVGEWHRDSSLHGLYLVPLDRSGDSLTRALDFLPRCPSVNRVLLPKMENLHAALVRLAKMDHIIALDMRHTDPTAEDLSGLSGMKGLGLLDLSHNQALSDDGIAAMENLRKLRYLDLTQTNVTGTGLKDRADMVSLEDLNLIGCPVTDETLAAIPRFPKLTTLFLDETEVTDKGLMSLVGWASLRRVRPSKACTPEGIKAFNDAFVAARQKAREAGEQTWDRDIAPVFVHEPVPHRAKTTPP